MGLKTFTGYLITAEAGNIQSGSIFGSFRRVFSLVNVKDSALKASLSSGAIKVAILAALASITLVALVAAMLGLTLIVYSV